MQTRIEHPQDADRDYDFAVIDAQGAGQDVTGWTFDFTVWNDLAETPAKLFNLTSGAGGIVVDVPNPGVGRIRVLAATVGAFALGRYRFEHSCVKNDGKPEVLATGTFILITKKPTS